MRAPALLDPDTAMKQRIHSMVQANRGVALIEALIGILIFSIGVLGLVGLQVTMTRAQSAAKYRADAAYLSSEIFGIMWSDRAHLSSYVTSSGSACSYQRCADIVNKITAALPQGGVSMDVTPSTGAVNITMTWAVVNEGTRTYVLSTIIQ